MGVAPEEGLCCFCGEVTVVRPDRDGVRLDLSGEGPQIRMLVWAHVGCLSDCTTSEHAGYLADAPEATDDD